MTNDYSLGVITWNLAGGKNIEKLDANEVLESVDDLPDICFIGF